MTTSVPARDDPATAVEESRPAVVDVLAHLRSLRRELPAALVAAVLAGIAVFLVQDARVPLYEAKVKAWVDTGADSGSAADVQTRATVTASAVAMAEDPGVLQEIASAGGVRWTADQTGEWITVAEEATSQLTSVRVLAPSPDAAARVADQVVEVLDGRIGELQAGSVADQLAGLRQQVTETRSELARLPAGGPDAAVLQQDLDALLGQVADLRADAPVASLTPLSAASATDDPVSPRPLGNAVTVALAVLLVVAEGLALARRLLRSRRETRPSPP